MITMSIVALTRGIKILKKNDLLQVFNLLLAISIIDGLSYVFMNMIFKSTSLILIRFSPILQSIYLSVEYTVFSYFYFTFFKESRLRILIASLFISFIIISTTSFALGNNPFEVHYTYFVIIEIVLGNVCFATILYNKIFTPNYTIERSNFEISKGFFIFINLTAPYYIISNFLNAKYGNEKMHLVNLTIIEALNSINDIGYIILFYSFYKGFIWKTSK